MSHTVGIVGVNGNVGQKVAVPLAKAAQDGKINLVVFHRASGPPKVISKGGNIEFRVLHFDDTAENIRNAVKGINVFISTVGFSGLSQEPTVVNALAQSPDFITYIPATYSLPWHKEDFADPRLGPILSFIHMGWDRAKELGLAVTPIYTSVFDAYWFKFGFLASSLESGVVMANEKQLRNRLPITSLEHLGQTITHIATSDPSSVKNRAFYCVTFWPTGNELVTLHARLNGKAPLIKDFTSAVRDEYLADAENFGAAKVGYWDRWEHDSFIFEQNGWLKVDYDGPELEEIGRKYA